MSTQRHRLDPKRLIQTSDGEIVEVAMWYRDGLPDHIAVGYRYGLEAITFSLDDPDVVVEIGEAITALARHLPPPTITPENVEEPT